MERNIYNSTRMERMETTEVRHISRLTKRDALKAASLTGFEFTMAEKTRYGWVCWSPHFHLPFTFVVRGRWMRAEKIRFGLDGVLTENIRGIVNFLQFRYEFSDEGKQGKIRVRSRKGETAERNPV